MNASYPLLGRQRFLLETIRREGGIWHNARVRDLYEAQGIAATSRAIRRDLQQLADAGHLNLLPGTDNGRRYRLRKDNGNV